MVPEPSQGVNLDARLSQLGRQAFVHLRAADRIDEEATDHPAPRRLLQGVASLTVDEHYLAWAGAGPVDADRHPWHRHAQFVKITAKGRQGATRSVAVARFSGPLVQPLMDSDGEGIATRLGAISTGTSWIRKPWRSSKRRTSMSGKSDG